MSARARLLAQAALLLSLSASAQACSQRSSAAPNPPAAASSSAEAAATKVHVDAALLDGGRVRVAEIVKRAPRLEARFSAEVAPTDLGRGEASSLTAGRVSSIEVAAYAKVEKGQILAWIDAPEVGRATADLLRARARAEVAHRKLARQLELEKEKATSGSAVDDARAEALVADADLSAARTWVASLGAGEPPVGLAPGATIGAKVAIRAPIAGMVLKRSVVVGGVVSPERPLFEIASPDALVVVAHVPETAKLPLPGDKVTIAARAKDSKACTGIVASDAAVYDPATRTRALRITPDAACAGLAAGGFADVGVSETGFGTSVVVVPRAAIVDVRGTPVVFVEKGAKGEFVARGVRTAGGAEGEDVVVEAGVAAGDRVVVVGALLLKGELLRSEFE